MRLPTNRSAVRHVLDRGIRVPGARVVLLHAPGTGQRAFIAGRGVGGAVVRNRARRVLREAWRELDPRVPDGYDIVLVARNPIRGARTPDLMTEMTELLRRAELVRP